MVFRTASAFNIIRNALGGFVFSYGFVSMLCFFYLQERWNAQAPSNPDFARGLIYQHDEHGSITYFSAFQATSCYLLFSTSIPIAFLAAVIVPKQNIKSTVRWYGFRMTWDPNDPQSVIKWGAVAGALSAIGFISFVGPVSVHVLNSRGIILRF